MRMRLVAAGMRPVNNIVDITNYVMLEYGQPMHAFDIDAIKGGIIVRTAYAGEKITTLDGVERVLDTSMLVIADEQKAVGIAGVMGGENSKITGNASAILFESAAFNGVNIRKTAKKLGLRTDSSAKYEKGLDPNVALIAVNRAVQLVEELGCGEAVPGMADNYPAPRQPRIVPYNPDSINALLGCSISAAEMEAILTRLEIPAKDGRAVAPTFRYDIEGEADLAEEIARIYGYDNIPATTPRGAALGKKSGRQKAEGRLRSALAAMGYNEALTYAFESPKVYDKLGIEGDPVRIVNPLGEDFSIMRTTTLPAMLTALSTNYNRRNEHAALFEMAKIYEKNGGDKPIEHEVLTLACYSEGFFEMKGIIEELLEIFGIDAQFAPKTDLPFMHPGKTAAILVDDNEIGYFGEINPKTTAAYEIETEVFIASIRLEEFFTAASPVKSYTPLPKFPGIARDIAVVVKNEITAAAICAEIQKTGGKYLRNVAPFDVYQGKGVADGHKSMALRMNFRADDRTMQDAEVDKAIDKILNALRAAFDAVLRG